MQGLCNDTQLTKSTAAKAGQLVAPWWLDTHLLIMYAVHVGCTSALTLVMSCSTSRFFPQDWARTNSFLQQATAGAAAVVGTCYINTQGLAAIKEVGDRD
jgi:hypothetical protein